MGNAAYQLDDEQGLEDGGMHEVKLAATGFLTVAGLTAYHTSVIVDDQEFLFDSLGIMVAPPLWSHLAGHSKGKPETDDLQTEVSVLGRSPMSGRAMAQILRPHFMKGSYDILYKNCNHFTDCALYVLLMQRLPGKYSRGERLIMATDPVSTGIMNRVFKSFIERNTGKPCEVDIYVTNPLAEDFSADEVVAILDEQMEEDDETDDEGYHIGCTKIRPPPCCRQPAQPTSVPNPQVRKVLVAA
mmetsp:Transcript_31879/g.58384  ORF Transcript_31879/g.58384 Transcript_31879/m.58384 type:complete len:243 (-) Transcript_31879:153-881(-)